jgi:hypothetical protein
MEWGRLAGVGGDGGGWGVGGMCGGWVWGVGGVGCVRVVGVVGVGPWGGACCVWCVLWEAVSHSCARTFQGLHSVRLWTPTI